MALMHGLGDRVNKAGMLSPGAFGALLGWNGGLLRPSRQNCTPDTGDKATAAARKLA
ncbi:hypothetical protein ABID58_003316 [Bradyrhizobium sp. S3.2.6]